MQRPELTYTQRMLFGGMLLLTLLRWWLGASLEISPGEALLAEWGRHPSMAGLHGGFGTAWFSWMSTAVLGETAFGVRFFAPLLAAVASAVLYRLVSSLTNDKAAAWAVALFNLIPLVNMAAVFLRPEMPGMMFLLCGMAAVWRALRRASAWDWHWLLAGLLFGAGFLCWYGALFGPVSTLVLLLASRRWRRQLLRPGVYIMLAIAALFVWPVWHWNKENSMAGWYYFMEHVRPAGAGSLAAPVMMAGKWALFTTPFIFLGFVWALWAALRRWPQSDAARFFAAFALTPALAGLAASVWGGASAWWLAPAMPALCGLLPWAWEFVLAERLELKQRFQWLAVLPTLVMTPLALDAQILRHAGLPLSLVNDPSRDWRGWDAIAREVTRITMGASRQSGSDNKGASRLFLIARDERLTSVLNFLLPRQLPVRWPSVEYPLVHCLESGLIENVYHTWPRYDAWPGGRNAFAGCTALYISDDERADPPPNISRAFESWSVVALFDVSWHGLPLRRVRVFACFSYRGLPVAF